MTNDIPMFMRIAYNPIYLSFALILLLLLFHWWLVSKRPLGKVGWKRIDYIWLAIAALGVIGQAGNVRMKLFSQVKETARARSQNALLDLKQQANFAVGPSVCRTFIKTENTSPNSDEVQREYNVACSELTRLTADIRTAGIDRKVGFLVDLDPLNKKTTDKQLLATIQDLEKSHSRFTESITEVNNIEDKTHMTDTEFVLLFLSPYLLVMAIALRITKVTGEIRIEKESPPRTQTASGQPEAQPVANNDSESSVDTATSNQTRWSKIGKRENTTIECIATKRRKKHKRVTGVSAEVDEVAEVAKAEGTVKAEGAGPVHG